MTVAASARIRPLDPKFAKVVALMRSTEHEGEKASARATAERLAADAGMTLDEAEAIAGVPQPTSTFFAGFDDFCEQREPGYKAKRQAEKVDKIRAWKARRAALIAKYGSLDGAIAPCERERLILAAVAPWRVPQENNPRWTRHLGGWSGYGFERDKMPEHVLRAIEQAYPLPTTFAEAAAENAYWRERDQEIEDAIDDVGLGTGDTVLDTAAGVRAEIVQEMAEHAMPVSTIADLHDRLVLYRLAEVDTDKIIAAVIRDVEAMAERERQAGTVGKSDTAQPRSVHAGGQVADLLRQHPDWPDRRIARAAGCSPTTVGKVRRAIGADSKARCVQRGGQTYSYSPRWWSLGRGTSSSL